MFYPPPPMSLPFYCIVPCSFFACLFHPPLHPSLPYMFLTVVCISFCLPCIGIVIFPLQKRERVFTFVFHVHVSCLVLQFYFRQKEKIPFCFCACISYKLQKYTFTYCSYCFCFHSVLFLAFVDFLQPVFKAVVGHLSQHHVDCHA